jgi:hypothetical protein
LSFDIGGTERATVATTGLDVTSGTLSQGGTAVSLSGHGHSQADVTNLTTDLDDKVSKTIVDAKGDLIVATAADTVSRLAVSATAGDVLTVDSSTATGLKWAAQSGGGGGISAVDYEFSQFGTSGIMANLPRYVLTASSSPSSGMIVHNKITPHKTITISNIAMVTGATSAGTLTIARMGIYTRSGTTLTLVARTANDVTLFQGAATKYTRALDTTGGYPATYTMTAGTEYFISCIQVSSTVAPFLSATARNSSAANAATGVQQYSQTGQGDLIASSTGSAQLTAGGYYAEVS